MDASIAFEELPAFLDSRDIDITVLPEDVPDNASYFGRIFARSEGLSDAVAEGLKQLWPGGAGKNHIGCDCTAPISKRIMFGLTCLDPGCIFIKQNHP